MIEYKMLNLSELCKSLNEIDQKEIIETIVNSAFQKIDFDDDPDTNYIKKVCDKFIGSSFQLYCKINFMDNLEKEIKIDDLNIVGVCIQDLFIDFLQEKLKSVEKGPKQSPPDFWNRNKEYSWEIKAFYQTPSFDISNVSSYISQLSAEDGVKNKLYKTKYIIFKYNYENNKVKILDYKICRVWQLLSYNGKYPLSLQSKRGTWYNLRPGTYESFNDINKTPKIFIEGIYSCIRECPNHIDEREKIISSIKKQFDSLL